MHDHGNSSTGASDKPKTIAELKAGLFQARKQLNEMPPDDDRRKGVLIKIHEYELACASWVNKTPEAGMNDRQKKFAESVDRINRVISDDGIQHRFDIKLKNPMSAHLDESTPHPVYKEGEKVNVRVQDYLSIALKSAINRNREYMRGEIVSEIQMAFGGADAKGRKNTLVISGNSADDNKMIIEKLNPGCPPVFVDGVHTFTLNDSKKTLDTVLAEARSAAGTRSDDLNRRMNKLEHRWDSYVSSTITVHVPEKPKAHAELEVLEVIGKMKIKDTWEITGSKLPCVGCAAHLKQSGADVADTTVIYPSQLPDPEMTKALVKSGVRFGQSVSQRHQPAGSGRTGNRRESVSPSPKRPVDKGYAL